MSELGTIKPVQMPPKDGRPIPNPVQWACGLGHLHPSPAHAVKCRSRYNRRMRERGDK